MSDRSGASRRAARSSLTSRPLHSLVPGERLSANAQLEGNLVSIVPYDVSTRTCAFTIVQHNCRVKCVLKGPWSIPAPDFLRYQMNRRIWITTDGTETVQIVGQQRDRNGDPVLGGNQLGISFENGISGYWRDERRTGRREPFVLKSSTSQPGRIVELSSEPEPDQEPRKPYHLAPSVTAPPALCERTNILGGGPAFSAAAEPLRAPSRWSTKVSDPATWYDDAAESSFAATRERTSAQEPTTSKRNAAESSTEALYRKLHVPIPMPAAEALVGMVQLPSPRSESREELATRRGINKREAPVSSPAPSAATASSSKAATKRQRREERTEWGLKTDTHIYPALADFVTKNPTPTDRKLGLNVIAVARAIQAPKQFPPGMDYGIWLELYDPTFTTPKGVSVRYYASEDQFQRNPQSLPAPCAGDVIVIQRVNWSKDKQQFTAYKEKGEYFTLSPDLLLKGSPISVYAAPSERAARITEAELNYARDLARWSRRNGLEQQVQSDAPDPANPSVPSVAPTADVKVVSRELAKKRSGRPTLLIEEIVPDAFCDLYAEVVRWYNPHATRQVAQNAFCSLFVTDYTANPQLIEYQDDSKTGVPGQHVLQVSVFGAQCEPLLRFKDSDLKGRIVHLRNIRPKQNQSGLLEATMVEDYKYPNKRDVSLLGKGVASESATKEWFEKLTARRKAFWSQARADEGSGALELASHGATAADDTTNQPTAVIDPLTEVSDIRGMRELSSLADSIALDSPGTYRVRVRVIDHFPPRLEDWVVATCPVCYETLVPSELACITHNKVSYRWMFLLALVDEKDAACHVQVMVDEPVTQDPSDIKILAGMTTQDAAQVRAGDSTALHRFRARVLRGIVGSIPDAHRHRKEIQHGMAGPAWDAVLEADRVDDGRPVEWRFKPGKVMFW
ncbi:hypothetical protein JCM3774_002330 [Rhodotorula dairenensis]